MTDLKGMINKKLLIYAAVILAIVFAVYYIYNKELKIGDNNGAGTVINPFENLVIPEDVDEATRVVMQTKIDNTKAMYEDKPDIWETWIAIGNLKVLLGDYEGAIAAYRESISLQSNNILGYRNIAEVYKNNLRDYEKAQEFYGLAIEVNPLDPESYIAKALIEEFQLNDIESAERAYLAGLAKTGNNFEILNRALIFYERNNQPQKAAEIQKKINELYPDSAAAQEINL